MRDNSPMRIIGYALILIGVILIGLGMAMPEPTKTITYDSEYDDFTSDDVSENDQSTGFFGESYDVYEYNNLESTEKDAVDRAMSDGNATLISSDIHTGKFVVDYSSEKHVFDSELENEIPVFVATFGLTALLIGIVLVINAAIMREKNEDSHISDDFPGIKKAADDSEWEFDVVDNNDFDDNSNQ